MCIRDSGRRALRVRGARAGAQRGGGHAHRNGERRGARDEACLLYTSDAADERSSVDLGGRRIIKKKITIVQRSH